MQKPCPSSELETDLRARRWVGPGQTGPEKWSVPPVRGLRLRRQLPYWASFLFSEPLKAVPFASNVLPFVLRQPAPSHHLGLGSAITTDHPMFAVTFPAPRTVLDGLGIYHVYHFIGKKKNSESLRNFLKVTPPLSG